MCLHLRSQIVARHATSRTAKQPPAKHRPNIASAQLRNMADIKAIKDQIWYIKRDIQNEEKKRDEWATTVSSVLAGVVRPQ